MKTKTSKGLLTALVVLGLVLPGLPTVAQDSAVVAETATINQVELPHRELGSDTQELEGKADEDERVTAGIRIERPSLPSVGYGWVAKERKWDAVQSQKRVFEFLEVEEGGRLDPERPEYRGYIIQFQEEPVMTTKSELQRELEAGRMTAAEVQTELSSYASKLESAFQTRKAELQVIIPEFEAKTYNEFKNAFHGIALDISEIQARKINRLDFVRQVYPNYEVEVFLQDSISIVDATSAWDLGYTGTGTVIAIIDTGIDYHHPDLGGGIGSEYKVIGGYDFVNNDHDPMDDHGHGTHVAGIAAGKGDVNDNNVYEPEAGDIWGVAPDAQLLAYKVLDDTGRGYQDWVIAGIEQAVSDGADVINLSLGGWGNPDDAVSQAVDNAVEAGVVVVVAAGNRGPGYETILSPGTARKAITVGASAKDDGLPDFSSRGPVIWDNKSLIKPDLVAPGVWITGPVPESVHESGYETWRGTSMAAPHVAGAAALVLQKTPTWTPQEIKTVLRNTAVDLPGEDGRFFSQGHGRLDIAGAIDLDFPQPTAELIDIPYEVSGTVEIWGTATSANFESFGLYYSAEYPPVTWVEITSSSAPAEQALLESFDTFLVPDGEYLLKLAVKDTAAQISRDVGLILVNSIELTHPLNNDIYRLGDVLDISGTVQGTNFENYVIEWGVGEEPVVWYDQGIDLMGDGTSQTVDGVLATWGTTVVAEAGFYTLRLTANFEHKTEEVYIRNIHLDPTLKEGWPQRIEWDYHEIWEGYMYPGLMETIVSDINNDGK